ncbi:Protein of unknown function [Tistlia consotensis]|uniref:Lipopolysaccharide assembly protein A domain-containing protein n=1 Tax=Tistlia consotensis USBA 355 TaxID=560819 RepID=A0A1Y6B5Z7_9PROT|nr:lipopolysaccharide assembly protein LapA domain-containing protein [Tistlia consotensis]SME92500.1 Protein of unknown function [Tistlia consotensis USBA 355]SNR28064.1 Protein of unknown function [Tistlia consotensis]
MKRLLWLLTALPLLVVLVVFSVNNRGAIAVNLWPLRYEAALPLFLVVLGSLVIGFLLGLLLEWLFEGRTRAALRAERRRLAASERELKKLRQAEAKRAAERKAPARPALEAPMSTALPAPSER